MNPTINLVPTYPIWYFINDILIIVICLIGIFGAMIFMYIILRLDYPSYTISNLIACKTCLAIGLMNSVILINNCYALVSDFRGIGYIDSFCHLRGTIFNILFIKMYTSLCLKAFNRLRCIVYQKRSVTRSYKFFFLLILIQWLIAGILMLPILLTDGVDYDWGSHLCLVTTEKPWQFIYLMIIYYTSILFITSVYCYILHYVVHLPLLEQYRRKRQPALFRRILILLLMLILPGISYSLLMIHWSIFHSLPVYSFKIITLITTIGHTGAILTIFLSNSDVRHRFYHRETPSKPTKQFNIILRENCDSVLLKQISMFS